MLLLRPAGLDAVLSAGAQIAPMGGAILRLRVRDRPVGLIVLSVEAVAAADAIPIRIEDAVAAARRARTAPAAVVLQAAADVVRLAQVGADRIELSRRNSVHVFPCLTAVVAHVETAVVTEQQVIAVARIDPGRVMVAVRNTLHGVPRLAAVGDLEERYAALVGDLGVAGIDPYLAVIHPAIALIRQEVPALSAIVRSPHATLGGIGRWCRTAASAKAATAALAGRHERPVVVDA